MNKKESLRNELFDLKVKLLLTKDIILKNEINEEIKRIKKAYSSVVLEEVENNIKKGR